MKIDHLEYLLPKKLIANFPADPRDHSKLLIVNRAKKQLEHDHFYHLPRYLSHNDVLVFNQTKVFPARLFGTRSSGGKVEILLIEKLDDDTWKAIHRGKLNKDDVLIFSDLTARVKEKDGKTIILDFDKKGSQFFKILDDIGHTPLPPYIDPTDAEQRLRNKYQTIYAKDVGSAAAPTAGLHFTKKLLEEMKKDGVQIEYVTLHVGLDTFASVKEDNLKDHQIHTEYYEVDVETSERIKSAKTSGKRIIAVGTTTTRLLETIATNNYNRNKLSGRTSLFIYPPYEFKLVDAMITNFHLPKSTLLALVSAFVSKPNTNEAFNDLQSSLIGKAYKEAIKANYRFYSFGDAMLIE